MIYDLGVYKKGENRAATKEDKTQCQSINPTHKKKKGIFKLENAIP